MPEPYFALPTVYLSMSFRPSGAQRNARRNLLRRRSIVPFQGDFSTKSLRDFALRAPLEMTYRGKEPTVRIHRTIAVQPVGACIASPLRRRCFPVRLYIERTLTFGDERKAFSREKVAHRLRWCCGYCGSSLYNYSFVFDVIWGRCDGRGSACRRSQSAYFTSNNILTSVFREK